MRANSSPRRRWKILAVGGMALAAGGLLSLPLAAAAAAGTLPGRPNIVLILADDLGYGDTGCYGAKKVATPHIDSLARRGMRFTDAYAASPVCCPSRYGLMTGTFPWRAPRMDAASLWATHESACLLDPGQATLASVVQQCGYHTGAIGKWHLGLMNPAKDWNQPLASGPLEHGFDYFFGDPSNRFLFYVENHRVAGLKGTERIDGQGRELKIPPSVQRIDRVENARVLNRKACEFIRGQKGEQPFFLYYAPNNVHTPLTPGPAFKGKSGAGVYGDFVEELDWSVGEILQALRETGQLERTLLLFSSDNGGRLDLSALNQGHRANGILLGQKTDVWEGGVHIPLIAQWPGIIAGDSVCRTPVMLTDLLATFMELVGPTLPDGCYRDGYSLLPIWRGQAPSPQIIQRPLIFNWGNRSLTFALRQGDWVYIDRPGSGGVGAGEENRNQVSMYLTYAQARYENSDILPDGTIKADAPREQLYNLGKDPTQKENVIRQYPAQAQEMKKLLRRFVPPTP